jgi:GNAT superfamily N-acetyltransferase
MQAELRYQRIGNEWSPQVIDLILPIQQIEFNVPITLKEQPDLLDIDKNYGQSGGGFWGAIQEEQIVGTIALIPFGNDGGAIRKMFVRKEFRGKEFGVAKQLLDVLITYCRTAGIKDLYLGTVEILKAALRFYEKNGFTRISMQDLPIAFPRMEVDTVFYHLHIG